MEVFEINEQTGGSQSRQSLQSKKSDSLRAQIKEKRERFDAELQQARSNGTILIKAGAADAKLKEQLAKLAEILSESSYIRNLERDLEGKEYTDGRRLLESISEPQTAWSRSSKMACLESFPDRDGSKLVPSVIYFDEKRQRACRQ